MSTFVIVQATHFQNIIYEIQSGTWKFYKPLAKNEFKLYSTQPKHFEQTTHLEFSHPFDNLQISIMAELKKGHYLISKQSTNEAFVDSGVYYKCIHM
jgi:hypothetical protein